jgi:hypothetical protein
MPVAGGGFEQCGASGRPIFPSALAPAEPANGQAAIASASHPFRQRVIDGATYGNNPQA